MQNFFQKKGDRKIVCAIICKEAVKNGGTTTYFNIGRMSEDDYMKKSLQNLLTPQSLKEFALLNAGTLLVAAGVYFFKFPNNFSTGGVSGLSIVLGHYISWLTPGTLVSILNYTLLIIGFIIFGRGFGAKTAYSTILMSLTIQILEKVYPMSQPFTSQPFMELLCAVGLPAIGSAMLFNIDASTGGTDVVAMILKKYTNMNIGRALLASDAVISLSACFAFGMETGLFSIFGLIIKSSLVDSVIESFNMCKYFTIVTRHPKELCSFITDKLHRSATVMKGEGAFSHDDCFVVLAVMNRAQAVQLQKQIRSTDPGAFMMITNTSEIIGKGFRGTN